MTAFHQTMQQVFWLRKYQWIEDKLYKYLEGSEKSSFVIDLYQFVKIEGNQKRNVQKLNENQ